MKTLIPIVLIVFLGFFSIGIPLATFPSHLQDVLGYSNVWIGIVLGLQSVATLLTRHFAGSSADIKGAKVTVLKGISFTVLSALVVLSSLSFDKETSLTAFLASRLLLGLGESLLITGALSWGIGLIGPANAGKVMAWSGMAMYGAIAASAPISLYVKNLFGFPGVIISTLILPTLAGLVAMNLKATPALGKERMPFYKVLRLVWKQGLGLTLSAVGFATLAGFSVLYFQHKGWEHASVVMTVFGVAFIAARLFFSHLPDKYGGKNIALTFLLIEGIGQALVWQAPGPLVAIIGSAFSGFGYSLVFPAFGVVAVKNVEPQFKGVALGAYVAFFDLALGITGPAAGFIATKFGYAAVYLFGVIACALSAAMALKQAKGKK